MTDEQEIERMANEIAWACPDLAQDDCNGIPCTSCLAKSLVNAGIGDKRQAVREFWEKLKDELSLLRFCDVATTEQEYYHSALNDVTYHIDNLFTKLYGG